MFVTFHLQPPKKTTVPAKKVKAPTQANPLFPSTPKSFRIGGDLRVSYMRFFVLFSSLSY